MGWINWNDCFLVVSGSVQVLLQAVMGLHQHTSAMSSLGGSAVFSTGSAKGRIIRIILLRSHNYAESTRTENQNSELTVSTQIHTRSNNRRTTHTHIVPHCLLCLGQGWYTLHAWPKFFQVLPNPHLKMTCTRLGYFLDQSLTYNYAVSTFKFLLLVFHSLRVAQTKRIGVKKMEIVALCKRMCQYFLYQQV